MSWLRPFESKRARLYRHAPDGPLREHLKKPWPARSLDVNRVSMVALDLETSGLDPLRDEIVSIGWLELVEGRIQLASARRQTIVPEGPLPASSVAIHGISDDQAAGGQALREALPELLRVLSGAVLVAHHAPLEAAFLKAACIRCYGAAWAGPAIDTLGQSLNLRRRRQQPIPQGGLRLSAARSHYSLPDYPEHDALVDALGAAELWLAIAADLRGRGSLPLSRVSRILP